MIAMQVAHIIAEFVVFLELSDEEALDRNLAVKMMGQLKLDLEALDGAFRRELVNAFAVIAEENSGRVQEVVRNIANRFYLEETIEAGDAVRQAELKSLRDARH
jgi:hypothetical protein